MSKGVDYGLGQVNLDKNTGIRYGVIPANEVCQAWADSSDADYGEPTCGHCGNKVSIDAFDQCYCDHCEITFDADEAYGDEPVGYILHDNEYMAEQYGGDNDIFILKSPYYTRAQFCSPCAPGACHLMRPTEEGEKCYCFGHDWFDGGVAPYPVYRVSNNELVLP